MSKTDDEDFVYICRDCLNVLAEGDLETHKQLSRHANAARMKLDGVAELGTKKIMLLEFA